jgi:hypothetical protein
MHLTSRSPWRQPLLYCGLLLLGLCGCESDTHKKLPWSKEGMFTPVNFNGDAHMPLTMKRVVLLPVAGGDVTSPETAAELDSVFATALGHQMRFEVVTLSRDECLRRFGREAISSASALPPDLLKILGHDFGAQGVLFVDLTAFEAYRPLELGVRAKLAFVADSRLVWSFDEVFSADNPVIANSVTRYYSSNSPTDIPMDNSSAAFISPNKFAAYVADTVFKTLPHR